MKRIIGLIIALILLVWHSGYGQNNVRTEYASDRYKRYFVSTTGDTLFTIDTTHKAGTSIQSAGIGVLGHIIRLSIGTPIASDTIILKNGADTLYKLIEPASAPFVYNAEIDARADSSLIFIQKKSSGTTVVYRLRY